jgi:hypothetical protein
MHFSRATLRFRPGYCEPFDRLRSREAGRLAEPSETKIRGATSAPRRRFLSPPVALRATGCDNASALAGLAPSWRWLFTIAFTGPASVLVQHAGTVVSRGEPLDGASPAPWLRRPWNGSAGPSPLSNDSGAFPAGRTMRIMREEKRVWTRIFCERKPSHRKITENHVTARRVQFHQCRATGERKAISSAQLGRIKHFDQRSLPVSKPAGTRRIDPFAEIRLGPSNSRP